MTTSFREPGAIREEWSEGLPLLGRGQSRGERWAAQWSPGGKDGAEDDDLMPRPL